MSAIRIGCLARLVEVRGGTEWEPSWVPGAVVHVEAGPNVLYPVVHDYVVRTTNGVTGHVLSRQLEPIVDDGNCAGDLSFSELMESLTEEVSA